MKKKRFSSSLPILLLLGFFYAGHRSAAALEQESAVVQAKQGDLLGAVATYKVQHDTATRQGLIALQQLAIEVLRLGLRIGDPHERNVVAGILGRRGDPGGLFVLDEALQSDKPMLRRTAADVLGDMATPDAVGLLRRLYYKDSEGQRLALSGLRRTRDKTALLLYLDAVSSTDTRIRTQGAGGLGELRSPAASPVLQILLKTEKDPIVAATLAWSLAAAGDPTGLAYLTEKLSDSSEQVRDAVVGLLGSLDDPSVVPLLRTALQSDESEMVRTTAAASLTHFKDASGLPLVQQALEHVDFRIRLAAAISFTRMDYTIAKPLVVKALSSQDPLVRSNAYQVIGQSMDSSVAGEVMETVDRERDRYAKAQGLWTVGRIGGAESLPQLLDLLAEEQEEVRHASAEAMVLISDRLLQSGLIRKESP